MDWSVILTSILSNPGVQNAALGIIVALGTQLWKSFATQYDASGTGTKQAVPLQLVTILGTIIASAATLASQNKLEGFDTSSVINFVTVALPTYLASLGVPVAAASAHNQIKKMTTK